jgi:hypothetical protein
MATDRVNEMNSINGSLSALASVVAALTAGAARKHVPYRDSRLTHLLQVRKCDLDTCDRCDLSRCSR